MSYPSPEPQDQEELSKRTLEHSSPSPAVTTGIAPAAITSALEDEVTNVVREETIIPLLEERLQVDYQRRKIGEVVVRKTIETRYIKVPVRYEKLHIEQISPNQTAIAEVDLSQGEISEVELIEAADTQAVVTGEFTSPRLASQILYELGKTLQHQCQKVRIEVELKDANLQDAYQDWLNKFSL